MSQAETAIERVSGAALMRPATTAAEVIRAKAEVEELIKAGLTEGVDFGVIPGTGKKPTLLKPGAEKVCGWFDVGPEYVIVEREADHDREVQWAKKSYGKEVSGVSRGLYRAVVECRLIHRPTGQLAATGIGSCSTLESKYVDRPRECENTVLKMAQKRAFVSATLNFAALSERFTQDVEDMAQPASASQQAAAKPKAADPSIVARNAAIKIRAGELALSSEDWNNLAARYELSHEALLSSLADCKSKGLGDVSAWLDMQHDHEPEGEVIDAAFTLTEEPAEAAKAELPGTGKTPADKHKEAVGK